MLKQGNERGESGVKLEWNWNYGYVGSKMQTTTLRGFFEKHLTYLKGVFNDLRNMNRFLYKCLKKSYRTPLPLLGFPLSNAAILMHGFLLLFVLILYFIPVRPATFL